VKRKKMKFIGIDPDVHKSGYAEIRFNGDRVVRNLAILDFWQIVDELQACTIEDSQHIVLIEAGYLNKTNFHARGNKKYAAKIGERVGANHQIGKLFVEYCKQNSIDYREIVPRRSKVKAPEFETITGYSGRTNQEQRDAMMLIYREPEFLQYKTEAHNADRI